MKFLYHKCQIIDQKIPIPAIWIQDENYFVLGHLDSKMKEIKIIMAIKYKNITVHFKQKSSKLQINVEIRSYNHQYQKMGDKKYICIRGMEIVLPNIFNYQRNYKEK